MSDKYPVTKRDDVSPESYTTKKKVMGESFNTAANAPNNPTKDRPTTSYNPNADYCGIEDFSGDE